jgi:hypothetical protein
MALSEAIPIAMTAWVSQAQPILRKRPGAAGKAIASRSPRFSQKTFADSAISLAG